MSTNIAQEIARLGQMGGAELKAKYIEVFGEATRSSNKEFLVKRIAWRIQANAWGDLTSRAKRRAEELSDDANLRTTAPRSKPVEMPSLTTSVAVAFDHDPRLPMPGTVLRRQYKDREIVVHVLPKGFEWDGQMYRSLSGVACAITGSHVNGFQFFNMKQKGTAHEQSGV
jgi:hypothetical protein